jgi:succinyl-diaminopimelate desuccinylase
MDLLKLAEKYEQKMIEDTRSLLKIKSVKDEATMTPKTPFGEGINNALTFMLDLAQKDGFTTLNDENYAGHIEYGEGDEIVGILCHLDVVPEGDNWDYAPYEAEIHEGKIYARGSQDDKGPTMAAYYALKILKDQSIKLNKKIRIILGTDEESGWGGITHYFKKYPMPGIGFAPDADFPLIYGEKGILSIDLERDFKDDEIISFKAGERYNVVPGKAQMETVSDFREQFKHFIAANNLKGQTSNKNGHFQYFLEGKSAHAMEPEKGRNAGTYLAKFASEYITNPLINFMSDFLHEETRLNKLGLNFRDPEMGDLTCNVGVIDINGKHARAGLNLRCPIHFDEIAFYDKLQKALNDYGLQYKVVSNSKPHYVNPNDELVKTLYDIYVKYTGDNVNKPKTIGGGTYARAMKKAVAYGMLMPGREDVVHQANEYVVIEDMVKATAIYAEAMMKLGK